MTETIAKAAEFAFLGAHMKVRRSSTTLQVQWYAPLDNWFKLNSNGSSMGIWVEQAEEDLSETRRENG